MSPADRGRAPAGSALLVDADEQTLDSALDVMLSAGLGVAAAGTGSRALEVLAMERFELVLVSMDLPDMSGDAAVKPMRRAGVAGCVAVFSSMPGTPRPKDSGASAADHLLAEPASVESLAAEVNAFVAIKRRKVLPKLKIEEDVS